MWSEYLAMMERSCGPLSRSLSSSLRCNSTVVPACGRSARRIVYSPLASDSQRTASVAGRPVRRVVTVTRSATIKAE